jgi:putative lipoic acid-binding regulatory protein
MSDSMKEMMQFPTIFTFKAMGENTDFFKNDIKDIFRMHENAEITENVSSKGTYTSLSVTVEIISFDELQNIYTKIKQTKGLKYHL